ncbi:MAG: thioredoxin [Christensenellaceae bacterium]|jgi:thioredoxin 1|nr:thioredoxin [Christensenellaceae bacterium]
MIEIEHANESNFEKVIKSKSVVMIDFFATWCGPCKMLSPILEQIANENEVDIGIAKLDIDESLEIAKQFGVMSVPTMIIFKDGDEIERLVGLKQKAQIIETLKNYIGEE